MPLVRKYDWGSPRKTRRRVGALSLPNRGPLIRREGERGCPRPWRSTGGSRGPSEAPPREFGWRAGRVVVAVPAWLCAVVDVEIGDQDHKIVTVCSLAWHDEAPATEPGCGGTNRLTLLDIGRIVIMDEWPGPGFGP